MQLAPQDCFRWARIANDGGGFLPDLLFCDPKLLEGRDADAFSQKYCGRSLSRVLADKCLDGTKRAQRRTPRPDTGSELVSTCSRIIGAFSDRTRASAFGLGTRVGRHYTAIQCYCPGVYRHSPAQRHSTGVNRDSSGADRDWARAYCHRSCADRDCTGDRRHRTGADRDGTGAHCHRTGAQRYRTFADRDRTCSHHHGNGTRRKGRGARRDSA